MKTERHIIIDPIGEEADAARLAECKAHPDCFSCVEGFCTALKPKYVGGKCVFYKERSRGYAENKAVYDKLVADGRYDLLDAYGDALSCLGAFDGELEEAGQMSEEMAAFRESSLQEILGGTG